MRVLFTVQDSNIFINILQIIFEPEPLFVYSLSPEQEDAMTLKRFPHY